jgi:Holliday junction resolvase RusA-like endonuclease
MVIKVEMKPLSINEAWQGKRFKTRQYLSFEKEILLRLPKAKIGFKKPIKMDITFGFSNSLSDIDNPLKPTLDCLQKKYGFNDRDIYELNVKKEIVEIGKEFISVKIT